MAIRSVSSKGAQKVGTDIRTANAGKQTGADTVQGSQGPGADKVSLTDSATQIRALETQISSLPIVNASHVSQVQHLLATGNYDFEPIDAADNMLEQEKAFAMSGPSEKSLSIDSP